MREVMKRTRVLFGGITARIRERTSDESGAISVEYGGLILFVGAIIAALVGSGIAADIVGGIQRAVQGILGG
jgi:Flp pilus assembly pilin Flp